MFMVEVLHGHEDRGLVKTFSTWKLSTFDISPLLMFQCQTAAQAGRCCVELRLCFHGVLCKCRCNLQRTPFSLLSSALVHIGNPLSSLMRLPQYKNSSTDSISFLLILIENGETALVLLTNRTFVSQTEMMSLGWVGTLGGLLVIFKMSSARCRNGIYHISLQRSDVDCKPSVLVR